MFSHHDSPLEVYVFAAVDERGEYVMSEICRRCNGKQQRRRRGGGSVQLPDWFMILHSSSRRLCTYTSTYVLFSFSFFPSHWLSSPFFFLPPINSRNSDPGSHSRLFFPLHTVARIFIARRFQLFLPSSTCVELCAYPR